MTGGGTVTNRWLRSLAIAMGPLWLPLYWLLQLAIAFVGICYYLVVERTLGMIFARTMNRTRVTVRWYTVPLLVLALPLALAVQLVIAVGTFIIWWHRSLARWQWGAASWPGIAAAIVFDAVFVLVFVGSYYHPLPWRLLGYDPCPYRWYRYDADTPVRILLTGPAVFGAVVLLLLPTVLGRWRRGGKWQKVLFLPRMVMAAGALYSTLVASGEPWEDPPGPGFWINAGWALAAAAILTVMVAVGLMALARLTVQGRSSWRQFVWFSSVRLLEKKRIALFSLAAVTLCTAMLLIILSVMGGFAENIREATHGLMGDVIMEGAPMRGFPFYQDFLDQLKEEPLRQSVAAATPVIYMPALLKVPRTQRGLVSAGVQAIGIDLAEKIAVSDFGKGLTWYSGAPAASLEGPIVPPGKAQESGRPGMIVGLDVSRLSWRFPDGHYERYVDPYTPCTVSVIPISIKGNIIGRGDPARTKEFYILGDSRTGVFDIDSNSVYVDFRTLQEMLYMNEVPGEQEGTTLPARVHQIQIKLRPGVGLTVGMARIIEAWDDVLQRHFDDDVEGLLGQVQAYTWEDYNRMRISAVETEKQLMMILFGIISLVTVFMVLCVFYMIVVEKTRDIGILKSIGASATQIALIFLAYAGVIGAVGSLVGTALGWVFVRHINQVHDWVVEVFGWRVWNREVYVFDLIPDKVEPADVVRIIIVATLASIVGAVIPAIRAARMNPVEALRYE